MSICNNNTRWTNAYVRGWIRSNSIKRFYMVIIFFMENYIKISLLDNVLNKKGLNNDQIEIAFDEWLIKNNHYYVDYTQELSKIESDYNRQLKKEKKNYSIVLNELQNEIERINFEKNTKDKNRSIDDRFHLIQTIYDKNFHKEFLQDKRKSFQFKSIISSLIKEYCGKYWSRWYTLDILPSLNNVVFKDKIWSIGFYPIGYKVKEKVSQFYIDIEENIVPWIPPKLRSNNFYENMRICMLMCFIQSEFWNNWWFYIEEWILKKSPLSVDVLKDFRNLPIIKDNLQLFTDFLNIRWAYRLEKEMLTPFEDLYYAYWNNYKILSNYLYKNQIKLNIWGKMVILKPTSFNLMFNLLKSCKKISLNNANIGSYIASFEGHINDYIASKRKFDNIFIYLTNKQNDHNGAFKEFYALKDKLKKSYPNANIRIEDLSTLSSYVNQGNDLVIIWWHGGIFWTTASWNSLSTNDDIFSEDISTLISTYTKTQFHIESCFGWQKIADDNFSNIFLESMSQSSYNTHWLPRMRNIDADFNNDWIIAYEEVCIKTLLSNDISIVSTP